MTLRVTKLSSLACALFLAACGGSSGDGDGDGDTTSSESQSEATDSMTTSSTDTMTTEGDGDGDGETVGDGDGDTTGDGDGDTTGDGDGDVPPCPYSEVSGDPTMGWDFVAGGFDRPVGIATPPTEPDRIYVIEQHTGNVEVVEPGETTGSTVMTIPVDSGGQETGLLGIAFHPNYPADPRFYLNYMPPGPDTTRISEFTMDAGGTSADAGSERVLMEISQPYSNHNGGGIAFGPDGYLYIGMGDGGSANDPLNSGQDTTTLLGAMLRIDVEPDGDQEYTVPADNPFVGMAGYAPEIWAYGVRNPWRFSWDTDGTMYIGDVGQDAWEEISIGVAGANLGWDDMEGFHCHQSNCDDSSSTPNGINNEGYTLPIIEHQHNSVDSICGGNVYRSCEVPGWHGRYIYGDLNSTVFTLEWDGTNVSNADTFGNAPNAILAFGGNAWGDVFVSDFSGSVSRLAPQ